MEYMRSTVDHSVELIVETLIKRIYKNVIGKKVDAVKKLGGDDRNIKQHI